MSNKYVVIPDQGDYTSELLLKVCDDLSVKVKKVSAFIAETRVIEQSDKLYLSSDTLFPLVENSLAPELKQTIAQLRNKYLLRKRLQTVTPDFFFQQMRLEEIKCHQFDFSKFDKYVIKPSIGFMAGGVRIISQADDVGQVCDAIALELKEFSRMYPNIYSEEFLIEQYIDGDDEYAVDMFYDHKGEPKLINIMAHPESSRPEYLHMLYFTNQKILSQHTDSMLALFSAFNSDNSIRNFPIHAEFKLNEKGEMVVVEFNSMRFGGMGLADLTCYASGTHPIESYFNEATVDWSCAFENNQSYCWILGYNGVEIDLELKQPNHEAYQKFLTGKGELLHYVQLDHRKLPAFSLAYLSVDSEAVLDELLAMEFNHFFC